MLYHCCDQSKQQLLADAPKTVTHVDTVLYAGCCAEYCCIITLIFSKNLQQTHFPPQSVRTCVFVCICVCLLAFNLRHCADCAVHVKVIESKSHKHTMKHETC